MKSQVHSLNQTEDSDGQVIRQTPVEEQCHRDFSLTTHNEKKALNNNDQIFCIARKLHHIVLISIFHTRLFSLMTLLILLSIQQVVYAQSVGVVLSGGGATALAHVGFLRVIEENDIPIDYIGGTSMGAVIAAMYASGFSVSEIDSIVRSDEFLDMATGVLDDEYKYYFKNYETDASFGTLRYSEGKLITNAIPTNLIDPGPLDWNFLAGFSQPNAAAGGDFDSLYIPFRCIAADVERKREILFRNGPLSLATRASSTYPFYLPPRRVDGNLLFDGGIYNNFPADVLYLEFLPDVILGCNVSGKVMAPNEEDLFSQLQSMILFRSENGKLCEHILVVEPKLPEIGTFDFEEVDAAIEMGFKTTLDSLNAIQALIGRRVTLEQKQLGRQIFKSKFKPLIIEEVEITGLEKAQKNYIKKIMGRRVEPVALSKLKTPYFRVFSDDKVSSIYPTATLNEKSGMFKLNLEVKKEKDLMLSFGGNYSSRSINTGFIGVRYNIFGLTSATLSANSYFGRFYGSVNANVRWDISAALPFSVQGGFTFNRWDFYKSLATFFEDVKPSYILLNERFGHLSISIPAGNKGMLRGDAIYTHMFDEYYQISNFLSTDTADRTEFDAGILRMSYERSTLNKKQFANDGTFLLISGKAVLGEETTIPGTTASVRDSTTEDHLWQTTKLHYQNYFARVGKASFGFMFEGVASTQSFFNNYIASSIAAPSFTPIPESRTFFLPNFRAHNYIGGGLMHVFSFTKSLDLRLEAYAFNPIGVIVRNQQGKAEYDFTFRQYYMGSSSLVFHSPLGPVSLSANYYDLKEKPWSFMFNFGYILFNRSARD
jgi:NTE family protein